MSATPRRRRVALRPQWAISLGGALAVVGFVAVAQWNGSLPRQQFTSSAQQVLATQVLDLEAEQRTLRDQIGTAEAEVQRIQQQAAGSQTQLDQLNKQLDAARLNAGLTRVKGAGVIVEIADSKRPVPPSDNPARYIVLVDDLHDIVNALWASGAEAIGINGERLVATTSIYGVGSSVLVNTAFLSPPFRIEAIGPAGIMDRFLSNPIYLGRVAQRIQTFGLEFAAGTSDSLDLPAFLGNTRFRWAVPLAGSG